MGEKLKTELWTAFRHAERIYNHSPEEAVQEWAQGPVRDPMPDKLTLYGFARVKAKLDPDWILEFVLEHLDEEYGDPDEYTRPTGEMKVVAQRFADDLLKVYKVWSCVESEEIVVDPCEYLDEGAPR